MPSSIRPRRDRGDTAPTFPPEAESLLGALNLGRTEADLELETSETCPSVPGYELLEVIGRGGMGVVFKARQIALNRIVALKMVGSGRERVAPAELSRFLAEAEAVAAVRHPNVVEVYDSGQLPQSSPHAPPRPYYAMEFVAGGSLSALLRERGPLPQREAAAIMIGIARGVHAAHEAGIVHRDLKPGNILLAGGPGSTAVKDPSYSKSSLFSSHGPIAPTPKVSDFGLAKRLSSDLTRTQAVMGTPAYMAPEQASGKAKLAGPTADIYALGAVLYECLTGTPPFTAEDTWTLLRQVMDDAPTSPRSRIRSLHPDLELICLKCLRKEPRDRYATAGELADDLDAFLAGRPVNARPIPAPLRVYRWAWRRPTAAALVVVIALLLLIGPPLIIWYRFHLDKQRVAAEEATKAEIAAKQAQAVAEEHAAKEKLFSLESGSRRRAIDRPPGWTWVNRTALQQATELTSDPNVLLGLRSGAVTTLIAPDFRALDPVAGGMTAAVVTSAANTPLGPLVALGEFKAWGLAGQFDCRIWLLEPASGNIVRKLTFPAVSVSNDGPAQDGVRSLAFSPDGSRLFVGSRSSQLFRFDLADPRKTPAKSWQAETKQLESLAVSPNGRAVFGSCDGSKAILRWDAETGQRVEWASCPNGVRSLAIDTQAGEVVANDGQFLRRFKLANGESIGPKDARVPNTARELAIVPGGRVLLAAFSNHLAVLDARTFREAARFIDSDLGRSAHEESTRHFAVHPSGAFVASAPDAVEDRMVKVWDISSGRLVGSIPVAGVGPIALAWTADGRFLFVTAPKHTLRYEFAVPLAARLGPVSSGPVRFAGYDPDGATIASLSESPEDDSGRGVLLRGRADGKPTDQMLVPSKPGNGQPGLCLNRATGERAITFPGNGLTVTQPGRVDATRTFTPKPCRCPSFSPDGSTLWAVVETMNVTAWDAKTGKQQSSWSNWAARHISGLTDLDALVARRDGAVAGGRDGTIHFISIDGKRLTSLPKLDDPVAALAVSPDDTLVLAASRSGAVRIIRTADAVELPGFGAHPGGVTALAFNHDGTLLATGGKDRTVRLWRRSGERFELLFAAADLHAPVIGLEFAPTGNTLAVVLTNERAARIWDVDALRSQLNGLSLGW